MQLPDEKDLQNFLRGKEMQLTDSSFAFSSGVGFDILIKSDPLERFYMYPTEPEEDKILSLFDELGIPHFARVETTTSYSVVAIPTGTRSLDRQVFREQGYTNGAYLGAYEIMAEIGKFLKRIQTDLHVLPQNLSIASFAIVTSEDELVRLVPPLLSGHILSPQTLEAQLLESLISVDPENNHIGQVKELMRNYI